MLHKCLKDYKSQHNKQVVESLKLSTLYTSG